MTTRKPRTQTHGDRRVSSARDSLDLLGLSPAAASICRYFLLRPDARPHTRDLRRVLRLGGASLHRELARLVTLGALCRESDGRFVRFTPEHGSPLWRAFRIIAATSQDAVPLVANAVADVHGLRAAFVFGSTARGSERGNSDIDIFILEDEEVDWKRLLRQLLEVEVLLGREVDSVRYDARKLAERLRDDRHAGSPFVRDILEGPKVWIAGGPDAIRSIAADGGQADRSGRDAAA